MPPNDPPSAPVAEREPLLGLNADELDAAVVRWGWPKFRGKQLRDWVYVKGVRDPNRMTNLSAADRATVTGRASFGSATVLRRQASNDGTLKLLLGWPDGSEAETVMIPDGDRRTACVSSQVGCPVRCAFCASGIDGVKRSLSADQIVEQVVALNAEMNAGATAGSAIRVNHVVFMGMGEPLANYANLMRAIRVLHDPGCLNLGARKITVSTVGVPAKMRQLAGESLPINLAISLHAPNEPLRKQLIPWAEHFALDDILDAARFYFEQTGREISLEYILLAGVNDGPEQAKELVRVCRSLRSNVNLIRYNEVDGLPFGRPSAAAVVAFQEALRRGGVNAHVRRSRGRDIDAACGQLRRKEQASREPPSPLVTLGLPV
jgi:23S rRNA (adenine2503-C2)-methyltransferase